MNKKSFLQVIVGCVENTDEEYIKALLKDYSPNDWSFEEFIKEFEELKTEVNLMEEK